MVLMILLVVSIAGIAALRTSALEERMAAISFDRALALQAAEIALRKAEEDYNSDALLANSVADWSASQSLNPALTVNGVNTNSYYLVTGLSGKPGATGSVSEVPVDIKDPTSGTKRVVSVWACSAASVGECKTGSQGQRATVLLKSTFDRNMTNSSISKRTTWQEIEL